MACEIKIDPITPALESGKGIHWDMRTQSLYLVDQFKGTIHCYKPECDSFTTAVVGCGSEPLAIIVPVEGKENEFVISLKNDLATITWDGRTSKIGEPKVLTSLPDADPCSRITNGKVDPKGRLWIGTTGEHKGKPSELQWEEGKAALYCLVDPCTVNKLAECATCVNGMEWTCDKKKFYFVDSAKYEIVLYDYCNEVGKICKPCPIFKLKDNNICGVFKSIAQDCDGKLYCANYQGCQVAVIDPKTCQVVNNIKIPAKEILSLCWGGPNYDVLFVSTGNREPNPKYPCAGRVFKVCNLGVRGMPGRNVCL